jgi:hypothetical protein
VVFCAQLSESLALWTCSPSCGYLSGRPYSPEHFRIPRYGLDTRWEADSRITDS